MCDSIEGKTKFGIIIDPLLLTNVFGCYIPMTRKAGDKFVVIIVFMKEKNNGVKRVQV